MVLPRWREALSPRGLVVTVDRTSDDAPWRAALSPLIARYSVNREYRPYDLLEELAERGLYRAMGRRELGGEIETTVDRVVEALHSQNGLARHDLGPSATASFDRDVRAALAPFAPEGRLCVPDGAVVTWGLPT